jgi:cytoskeletal protein CcmA (bactofilin family)
MFGSRFRKKKTDAVSGFLGSQTEFTGKLSFSGVVHLDGHFDGEIISRGTLVVGSESMVRADIHSNVLKIAGEVRGDLTATEKIELYPPARVYGNIFTPKLVIEEGVIFEGTCRMSQAAPKLDLTAGDRGEPIAEDPIEAISAEQWPPDYDASDGLESSVRSDGVLHKHGQ